MRFIMFVTMFFVLASAMPAYAETPVKTTSPIAAVEEWQNDLAALIQMDEGSDRDSMLDIVLGQEPNWQDAFGFLRRVRSVISGIPDDGFVVSWVTCIDNVERPYVLQVPKSYDHSQPSPLLMRLHGGVTGSTIPEDPLLYAQESGWSGWAERNGVLLVHPFGENGSTWWDEVGMDYLRSVLRAVKQQVNVDHNKVFMGGYSDGASAAFAWAMLEPTQFAGFAALSGHMGVGNLDGGQDTYAPNMANRPVYATTSIDDGLYPSERMRPTIEMAIDAGADIYYRELEGPHDFSYADTELPLVADWMRRTSRNVFSPSITWESASSEFGRCDWLHITSVLASDPEPWHIDHNSTLVSDRITIGFGPTEFEGPGVKVGAVVDDSAAAGMGLLEGDIIIRGDAIETPDMESLGAFKNTLSRGSAFELGVLRDGQELQLQGQIPSIENYFLFKRERPSARINATFAANRFDVTGSRVGSFSLYIHPEMVRMDRPVVVTFNGEVVFDSLVEPDLGFMLGNYLDLRDPWQLFVGEIKIEVE